MRKTFIMVGASLGSVSSVSPEGEVEWSVDLPFGKHDVADYEGINSPGSTLALAGDAFFVKEPRRSGSFRSDMHTQTAANPDFRPTLATPFEIQTRKMLGALQNKIAGLTTEAKATVVKKAKAVKADRDAQKEAENQASDPVIDNDDKKPEKKAGDGEPVSGKPEKT